MIWKLMNENGGRRVRWNIGFSVEPTGVIDAPAYLGFLACYARGSSEAFDSLFPAEPKIDLAVY